LYGWIYSVSTKKYPISELVVVIDTVIHNGNHNAVVVAKARSTLSIRWVAGASPFPLHPYWVEGVLPNNFLI
jgi:hypothetical protein